MRCENAHALARASFAAVACRRQLQSEVPPLRSLVPRALRYGMTARRRAWLSSVGTLARTF
ncbi:MAG: hypothetical protein LBH84_02560 [Prevotellaceae bacterium]|nr:hypothetical protein [Prevotellaceae bacterium]